jgi:hypothetical protein
MARPAAAGFTADPTESVEELEHRVRRLEDAVAALQDTQIMEDRVVERVAQRLDRSPLSLHDAPGLIVDAPRMLLPKTVDPLPDDEPTANGAAATAVRSTWLLLEVFREFRAILRMLTDYRYRMTWTGRIIPLIALGVAFFSWFLIGGRFLYLGDWVDKAVDVVLIVVVYKVLTREVQRYHELLARVYRYR